jgi:hypothetical protein
VNSSVPLLGVASVWRISENPVMAKFGTAPVQRALLGGYRTGAMRDRARKKGKGKGRDPDGRIGAGAATPRPRMVGGGIRSS